MHNLAITKTIYQVYNYVLLVKSSEIAESLIYIILIKNILKISKKV